jgi:hypothetical protein
MKRGIGFFLVIVLVTFSCSEVEQVPPDMGFDYFPLHVGNYSVYQVDEVTGLGSAVTQVSYEIRATVTDSTINENGDVAYFIVREKRTGSSENWENLDTWSAKVIYERVIQNEGNVLFVKLIFPPSLNLMWDGNEYNNLPDNGQLFYVGDDVPYVITEIDKPISLKTGFESDHTLTITQNDFNDFTVGTDERKEVYARGVGLVYKETNQVIKCNGAGCSGDRSFLFIQSLKEYGKI